MVLTAEKVVTNQIRDNDMSRVVTNFARIDSTTSKMEMNFNVYTRQIFKMCHKYKENFGFSQLNPSFRNEQRLTAIGG